MSSAQLEVSGEVPGEDFGVKPGVDGNEQQGGSVSKVSSQPEGPRSCFAISPASAAPEERTIN